MTTLDQRCIDTIRTLSIDAVQKANSGHPGLPLGAAPMAYVLWQRHLKHCPESPDWPDRDRFVLSAGHGSMLLYALLHLTGYDVSMDDIKNFRQWGSNTPGHPESFMTPGVEATTGPLGQGIGNAVGMAIAERALASMFNRPEHTIVDHFTYSIAGDGDLMEGVSAEACSLAGHLKLGKLILLYDSNDISLDGPTSLAFTEDVAKRYEAYDWQVITVNDGNRDLEGLDRAIREAKAETGKPTLIVVKTTIGFGSPNKAGSADAHGSPLGPEEIRLTKAALGWTETEDFAVPADAHAHFRTALDRGRELVRDWQSRFDDYARQFPELAESWHQAQRGNLPEGWDTELPTWEQGTKIATRAASGQSLNALAEKVRWVIGGDADLSCSTKTALKHESSFDGQTGAGRNIHFGVREFAMGAIANGMAYHGGTIPYTATFFCFADYMRPAMRLAALSGLGVVFVFTHDSIGLGEDGPTHAPVEHLASLRAMPNMTVIRPADATETNEAWRFALMHRQGPVSLVFSRQKLPVIDRRRFGSAAELHKGAYVLSQGAGGVPDAVIVATGSEVHLALEAQGLLAERGITANVVSMPSWELFAKQPLEYRNAVIPPQAQVRLAVEAGATMGWGRWVGSEENVLGVNRFGASAPGGQIFEQYGFTADRVCEKVIELLG